LRDIGAVIDAMVQTLPATEADLKARLLRVAEDAAFTAPERMVARWAELVEVFNASIFDTDDTTLWIRLQAPEWARAAGSILAGETP
jgi:hypothetical protein